MSDVLFNCRSELDKLPFGAVAAGKKIRFGIRLAEELLPESVFLVVVCDFNSEVRRFPLKLVWSNDGYARYEGSASLETYGLYWFYFVFTENGTEHNIEKTDNGAAVTDSPPQCWQLSVYSSDYTTPQWIKGGVFYHIFVDRFYRLAPMPVKNDAVSREDWGGIPCYIPNDQGEILNNDFFGGNLDGIRAKLPYLRELGVSCLYLSPIFEAQSNHKYDTGDYMRIDPSFGDDDSFKRLCSEAREKGIHVILDGVFNHTGSNSRYFNRNGCYDELGAYQSKQSRYYNWYSFTEYPDEYDSWWGIKTLPTVQKENEGFSNLVFGENGVLGKWMSLGADGWRLDVADELADSFLTHLREAVKRKNPDALIIGEVWEDASNKVSYGKRRHYFEGNQLDSVMNYPFKNAITEYIMGGSAEAIRETVETIYENYPKPALDCLMNILGTHDTPRILTVLGGESFATRDDRAKAQLYGDKLEIAKSRLMLASVLQFTLPGVPCIYYGDEALLQGYEDPFNRRCYPWGNKDAELIGWYKQLSNLRQGHSVYAGGKYRTLVAENGVFAFIRFMVEDKVMTLINLGEKDVAVDVTQEESILLQRLCVKNENSLRVLNGGCAVVKL